MKSINQEIARLLNQDIAIQKCLKEKLINIRSLAKYLQEKYELRSSLDAIISGIRRYDIDSVSPLHSKEMAKVFSRMSISTKDNIAKILLKDKAFKDICEDFIGKKTLRENCRIVKSKETVTLIVNMKDFEKKKSLFKDADVLDVQQNLSEIRLQFPKDISQIKGISARIAGELAMRDVNIEDEIYSMPELLIYVKENSLVSAHHALLEIKK
ncbi:hypothetical protein HOL21_04595 [Candidatus Woesearchaeota archaeon]|jgi:hypothetical protein|nr:hypothetical protein [Candidatus Woesearchaeota archaeon]MBT5397467.1 hypothetical protein [Candidatus Woesearchaeota archaeon]MBT6367960.1 hypothetical protein [Candidatus Woesearchaeota archaeon]MBT7763184.1 hypothetical protein [Candidatus Woesearchaeota archaeon]